MTVRQNKLIALLKVPLRREPYLARGKVMPQSPRAVYLAAGGGWFITHSQDLPLYEPFTNDDVVPLAEARVLEMTYYGCAGFFNLPGESPFAKKPRAARRSRAGGGQETSE